MVKAESYKLSKGEYDICTCAESSKFPFCDFNHQCDGSDNANLKGHKPDHIILKKGKTLHMCKCKQSNNYPYCDGRHIIVNFKFMCKRIINKFKNN